jgi:hypothetical protein
MLRMIWLCHTSWGRGYVYDASVHDFILFHSMSLYFDYACSADSIVEYTMPSASDEVLVVGSVHFVFIDLCYAIMV